MTKTNTLLGVNFWVALYNTYSLCFQFGFLLRKTQSQTAQFSEQGVILMREKTGNNSKKTAVSLVIRRQARGNTKSKAESNKIRSKVQAGSKKKHIRKLTKHLISTGSSSFDSLSSEFKLTCFKQLHQNTSQLTSTTFELRKEQHFS